MSTAARWRKTSSGMDLVTVESEHKTRRPALNCDFTWFLAAVSWSCSAHLCPPNSPSMPAVRSCTAHCSKLECPSSARRPRVTPLPAPVLPNVATPMTASSLKSCTCTCPRLICSRGRVPAVATSTTVQMASITLANLCCGRQNQMLCVRVSRLRHFRSDLESGPIKLIHMFIIDVQEQFKIEKDDGRMQLTQ
nr:uncharacterized protein LOC120974893 [Aegilops tauschii subsp. strangulata]XP_045088445.1 uncharacterized protein LOC120974893 [Aegilops tauschii subsp. strangulata]XP_045088446.1 uncharacterized protein LOC120974893 [Aegilops tauschii subsp. strangulata]